MYANDFPLSLYEEDSIFIVEDFDDPERFSTPEEAKAKADLKRFLALIKND
jgi:hypothetical protein